MWLRSSVEECRNSLLQLGVQDITPAAVARMLGIMVKTTSGLVEPISLQVIRSRLFSLFVYFVWGCIHWCVYS